MTEFPRIPAGVLANVRQRWPDVAESWATEAPTELASLCEQYQALPRSVLPARYGFVVAVDTADGPLVMRGSPDPQGVDQAAVAVALAKHGISPAVQQVRTTDHGTWTVLDRVLPGTSLYQADPTRVSLDALFVPFAAMHNQPAPRVGMPSILDWLRQRLDDDHLSDLRPGTSVAPTAERRNAMRILDELSQDHQPALCHGDASLGNVIASGPDRWSLIDPRGVTGESAYDVAVLSVRVQRFAGGSDLFPMVAEMAHVDIHRTKAWMLVANAGRV